MTIIHIDINNNKNEEGALNLFARENRNTDGCSSKVVVAAAGIICMAALEREGVVCQRNPHRYSPPGAQVTASRALTKGKSLKLEGSTSHRGRTT